MAEGKITFRVTLEYPEGWTERERDSERQHRERMAKLSADEENAVMRGHRAGYDLGWNEGQTAVLAGLKTLQGEPAVAELDTTQPTQYEVWRDALRLGVDSISEGANMSPDALLEIVEWFHDRLKAGPPRPPEPDCAHCGADSSMDHNEDCPNAPDPDNEPSDCVRCGAPPDGHPDGCPTMTEDGGQ